MTSKDWLLLAIMLALNSDPYGQASLVGWLPWGPEARRRAAARRRARAARRKRAAMDRGKG